MVLSYKHKQKYKTTEKKTFLSHENKFENIAGKGENAGNQHFLLFLQCFPAFQKQISTFESYSFCRLQMLSIWSRLKILLFIKESMIIMSYAIQPANII